ncbi:MAG: histidine phosphatase family protein [Planctomycetota bacterium]
MTLNVFLVRHAQSANNAQHEHLRVPDPPITELGSRQAQRLATALQRLQLTHLWTSPFLRSIQTTREVSDALGLRPTIHRDLFEQGGCYRGYAIGDRQPMPGLGRKTLAELCPTWSIDPEIPESGWNTLDHYEDRAEARLRADRVTRWIASKATASSERWGMIIHADFKLRLLEAMLERDDLEQHLGEVVNTSISHLSREGGKWKLEFWNSFQHLPPEEVTT